jgi:hypothetical protein
MLSPVQELYRKFDGADFSASNARLAWYGQCRAKDLTHDEAIQETFLRFEHWCREWWPTRNIPVPNQKGCASR